MFIDCILSVTPCDGANLFCIYDRRDKCKRDDRASQRGCQCIDRALVQAKLRMNDITQYYKQDRQNVHVPQNVYYKMVVAEE